MRIQRLSAAAALAVITALSGHPSAQQPPAAAPAPPPANAPAPQHPANDQPAVTFRAEVNYVEVDAAVYDKQGRFVGTLGKDDFDIYEDGQKQEITEFALVNMPVQRADRPLFATHPIAPDVVNNERPFDGRVYVIVLDDLHTQPYHTSLTRAAAKQFIERYMADNDIAAVIHASGKNDAAQDFTSNKALLYASIDRFGGNSLTTLTQGRLEDYQRQLIVPRGQGTGNGITSINDPYDMERGFRARQSLEVLRNVSQWIGSIRGRRKAVIWMSEGIDYDIYNFQNHDASTVMEAFRDAIASATRSNVSIYAVDPRGLTSLADSSIEVGGDFPEDPHLGLSPQSFQDELRLQQQSLRTLAEDTGGYAAVNSNDFSKAFERVVSDNSNYYLLGYYPTNDKRDGKYRKIDVRVKRQGLEVRARKGYTAPRGKAPAPTKQPADDKTSPELRAALDSPLPLPGITIYAYATPFKGDAKAASVAVGMEADGADFVFDENNGKFVDNVEISTIAIDSDGKIRGGDRNVVNMELKPETRARVAQTGVRVQTRLSLPPGHYQLRVAVRESGAGRIGTVTYPLEVPDFLKDPLSMSGIAVASATAQYLMTAKADDQLRTLLPGPATAFRDFPNTDTLAIFGEVYDNALAQPHKVNITTSVLTDDGRTVFNTSEERASSELSGKGGGYGFTARIPLTNFSPGLYVLKVTATSTLGKSTVVERQVPFRVIQPHTAVTKSGR